MKRLGMKKMKHTIEGHTCCSICHPETKSPKAREREETKKDIEVQMEGAAAWAATSLEN